jgi:hypothetical protein
MVDHEMHSDMSGFIRRRAVVGVHTDAGALMRRLEVLRDGFDGVLLKHTSGVLLSDWAPRDKVDDLLVVDGVARE